MAKKIEKTDKVSRWIAVIAVILFLGTISFFFSIFIGLFLSGEKIESGNVAVIPIQGIIQSGESDFLFGDIVASSRTVVSDIRKAGDDPSIRAIILDINSPGGSPVPSHEIVKAIKKVNKTTVALIRDTGASGAYWVASAADHIIADSFSIVGSIGVNSAFLTFGGLLTDFNVTYERIVGGEYKDLGSPFKDMTDQERALLQSLTDSAHEIFVKDVAQNRNMPYTKMQALATGEVFLGADGYRKGLVDDLGGMEEAVAYIEDALNISVKPVEYTRKIGLFRSLGISSENSYWIGYGLGKAISGKDQVGLISLT